VLVAQCKLAGIIISGPMETVECRQLSNKLFYRPNKLTIAAAVVVVVVCYFHRPTVILQPFHNAIADPWVCVCVCVSECTTQQANPSDCSIPLHIYINI
jgi:hypothetical protein